MVSSIPGVSAQGRRLPGARISPPRHARGRSPITLHIRPIVMPGSILAGFQSFTITQTNSVASQPPSIDWASPNAGGGNRQRFTFSISDPNGASNLRNLDVDFVSFGSNSFIWTPGTRPSRRSGAQRLCLQGA